MLLSQYTRGTCLLRDKMGRCSSGSCSVNPALGKKG